MTCETGHSTHQIASRHDDDLPKTPYYEREREAHEEQEQEQPLAESPNLRERDHGSRSAEAESLTEGGAE